MKRNTDHLIDIWSVYVRYFCSLKTSILKMKFKPDYDSAATEYDRAAVCFKNAGERGRCRDAYFKAAEMHKENGNLFHSAKYAVCSQRTCSVCGEE